MTVAVVGLGVVGKAQVRMFDASVTYDPLYNRTYPHDEIAACDFVVMCAPTPQGEDGHADLSYLEAAMDALPPDVPVLLRSTVPPGTTDRLKGDRLMCHCPEFMGENPNHPWQESYEVPFLVIGGDTESAAYFSTRMASYYSGIVHTTTSLESELTKYVENLYWATRVTYVNELAAICAQYGVDWQNIRDAWVNDPRLSPDYTDMAGHPPGFGGRCWPKDLAAMIACSTDAGYTPEFLKAVQAANERFTS